MATDAYFKLTIELVPASSFCHNVRAIVSKAHWDLIRSAVYSRAYYICELCGGIGKKHPVEAHEIWHYDDRTLIQKLERMIALCPNCHSVKHYGLAQIQKKDHIAFKHLMKINQMTKQQAENYIQQAFKIWEQRSNHSWKLNIQHLTEYNININKLKIK